MRTQSGGVMTLAILGAAFGGLIWMRVVRGRPPAAQVALVLDVSGSMRPSCASVTAMAKEAIGSKGLNIGAESRFALITTGNVGTGMEPELVYEAPIPGAKTGVLIGDAAEKGKAFYDTLGVRCRALKPAKRSAIFRAMDIALTWERETRGCSAPEACIIYLASDLRENVHKAVESYLVAKKSAPDSTLTLDNQMSSVTVCGYVRQTKAQGPPSEILVERWRRLFVMPEKIHFHPYCPGAAGSV